VHDLAGSAGTAAGSDDRDRRPGDHRASQCADASAYKRGSGPGELWKVLYTGFFNGPVGGSQLIVLYSIIPWIGVMAAGYAFGTVLTMEPARRNRISVRIGVGAIALFLVAAGTNLYGDPRPWSTTTPLPALLSFLNTTKYPASLSFLLMTLGPIIALIPLLDRARGRIVHWLQRLRAGPVFLLSAAHPADPCAGPDGLEDPAG